jgi:hypothetical protein
VPERNDCSDGDVGDASRPHAATDINTSSGLHVARRLQAPIVGLTSAKRVHHGACLSLLRHP